MLANRAVYFLNDNAMMHYGKILQRRQRQITLDKFLAENARRAIADEEESL